MIGRKNELATSERIYNSDKAKFVAVYGRRRVGKTYLVDEALKGKLRLDIPDFRQSKFQVNLRLR